MLKNPKINVFFILLLSLNASLFGGESNYYREIAEKFGIHPFEFKYGFPLWYNSPYESLVSIDGDDVPTRGIIFLTDSINYLETYSPTVYISQPTIENAKMIRELTEFHNGYGVYYLVVDSAIIHAEMTAFIEELGENDYYTEIRFVGAKGNYVNVNYWNFGSYVNEFPGTYCGGRNKFSFFLNKNSQLLIEYRPTQLSEIDSIIYRYLTINVNGERDSNAPLFEAVTSDRCKREINELKDDLESRNGDNYELLNQLIQESERKLEMIKRFGPIKIMQRNLFQEIKIQSRTPLKFYFQVLDQIQKGFFEARQEECMRLSGESYWKIMRKNDLLLLELLTLNCPNRLTVQFGNEEYQEAPPGIND